MVENKKALIRTAIIELKPMKGLYNGLYREFCPHILGTKIGTWKVFVWQFTARKPALSCK